MAWRWRCDLWYAPGSGMAAWGESQLSVRLTHAFHLREGSPDQELTFIELDEANEHLRADIFWPDDREDLAIDTRATFEAVTAWVLADDEAIRRFSFMDYHQCRHDLDPPGACDVTWRWDR